MLEAYSKASQTSKAELFAKIVAAFISQLLLQKSSILNIWVLNTPLNTGQLKIKNCVKRVPMWNHSGPYFPVFGLNTKRYSVSLRIQSECGKIRTRITPNTDAFHAMKITTIIKSRYADIN